jgi:hypothetical protein
MTPLGPPIRCYDDLHRILRERAEALNVSRNVLDDAAGLQNGYTSKILSPRPTKRLGALSMGLLLQALGLKLVAFEDDAALAKIKPMLPQREAIPGDKRAYAWGKAGTVTVSRRWVKRMAQKGGFARARALTPAQRRSSARRAALVRWKNIKEAARLTQSSS